MKTKLSEEKIYYVYLNITKDTGEVFYVGKGKKRRAFETNSRNKLWRNIVDKHGYTVEFVKNGMTEKEALDLEILEITKHKPRANLSSGGRGGATGLKRDPKEVAQRAETQRKQRSTPEWKAWNGALQREVQKRPEVKANREAGQKRYFEELKEKGLPHPAKGRKQSEETKKYLSDIQKGEKGYWYGKEGNRARKVINITTGKTFSSLKAAAESLNGSYRPMLKRMRNGLPYKNNIFRYEDGEVNKNREMSEETKSLYKERSKKMNKPIIHIETGSEYPSTVVACMELGLNNGQMSLHLNGKRPSVRGQHFKFKKS